MTAVEVFGEGGVGEEGCWEHAPGLRGFNRFQARLKLSRLARELETACDEDIWTCRGGGCIRSAFEEFEEEAFPCPHIQTPNIPS